MAGPKGKRNGTLVQNNYLADYDVLQADGTEYPLPKGDPRFTATAESYLQTYVPVDHNNTPLSKRLTDILGVTYDHEEHPEITAGDLNYH